MKIYKLITNKVEDLSYRTLIPTNYNAERTKIYEEFYLTKEKAEIAATKKTEALIELVGICPNYEFRIVEIEVIE